jgi:hypothetical protein
MPLFPKVPHQTYLASDGEMVSFITILDASTRAIGVNYGYEL